MPGSTNSRAGVSYDCGLSRPAPVSGRVTDESGGPLADVEVRIDHVGSEPDGRYELPDSDTVWTDADGRFQVGSGSRPAAPRSGSASAVIAARGWACRSRRRRRTSRS